MIFSWDIWAVDLMFAIGAIALIANRVSHLCIISNKRWVEIFLLVFLYLACIGMSIGHNYFFRLTDHLAHELKDPLEHDWICRDWGENMPKEKRSEYSQMLARKSFVDGGRFRDYIDLTGTRRPYQPTEVDRRNREAHLRYVRELESASELHFWTSLGWLAIPLVGVGMGFISCQKRKMNCLESPPDENNPLNKPPTALMRTKYWDTTALVILTINLLHTKAEPFSYVVLGFWTIPAIAMALYESHQIWTLNAIRGPVESIKRLLLIILVPTLVVGVFVILRPFGKITWSNLYSDVPLVLLFGISAIVSWFTEWKKQTRIYQDLQGLIFLPAKRRLAK